MPVILGILAALVALVVPWADPALSIWAKLAIDAGVLAVAAFAADMEDL